MKERVVILLSLVGLMVFITPGGLPVGAGSQTEDSPLTNPIMASPAIKTDGDNITNAPSSGSITGTVTDGSNPLSNILVEAYILDPVNGTSFIVGDYAYTNSSGYYVFDALEDNDYTIRFVDESGNYVSEYYDDIRHYPWPDLNLTIAGGNTLSNIDAVLAISSHISGRVTDAANGNPLGGISVYANDSNLNESAQALTDTDGSYKISDMLPGSYTVAFGQAGWPRYYVPQVYNNDNETPVVVGIGETAVGIDGSLKEGGHITGHVTAEDGTTPLEGITARLSEYWGNAWWPYRDVVSDANGYYHFDGFLAATYRLSFLDESGNVLEHYDNVTHSSIDNATDISVELAQTTGNIDASLAVLPSSSVIKGRVTDAGNNPIAGVTVSATGSDIDITDADGYYSISGLATGSYSLTAGKAGYSFTPGLRTVTVPPNSEGSDFTGKVVPAEAKPWTLMYYLAADNNLENLSDSIGYLKYASQNPNANIVAFSDSRGGYARYHVFRPEGVSSITKGELSTGNPNTLRDFILWAQENYPGERYALIIYDHGQGQTGVAFDEDAPGDLLECIFEGRLKACLTLKELRTALAQVGRLDVIYMEACLMATIEAAYQLRDLSEFYVASEQIMWGPVPNFYIQGIHYEVNGTSTSIPALQANTTAEQLAEAMARSYALGVKETKPSKPGTIATFRLAKVQEVTARASNLAGLLKGRMGKLHNILKGIKADVQHFDSSGDLEIKTEDELVDLYHFAELVAERVNDSSIQAAAGQLMTAIDDYVAYEEETSGPFDHEGKNYTWDHSNSHGVSIFLPSYSRSFYKDGWFDFAAGTVWDINNPTISRNTVTLAENTETIEWGSMLVEYVRHTDPFTPDDPNPPALIAPLPAIEDVYLPLILKQNGQ